MDKIMYALRTVFTFRWKPGRDIGAVIISCVLVTASLYLATVVVTPEAGGGLPYFVIYALLTATVVGIGFPLVWTVFHRQRPIQDLGITKSNLGISLALQLIFAVVLYFVTLARVELPPIEQLTPLIALALAIGFFEAVFWRGWVYSRLEEAFGIIPAVLVGSFLYAIYHIGYGMPREEIVFLFFIGILFAAVFRLTRSIFILWPVFQPMGQLVTLIEDGLQLPLIAALGFLEVLVVMVALVWLANRYHRRRQIRGDKPVGAIA